MGLQDVCVPVRHGNDAAVNFAYYDGFVVKPMMVHAEKIEGPVGTIRSGGIWADDFS